MPLVPGQRCWRYPDKWAWIYTIWKFKKEPFRLAKLSLVPGVPSGCPKWLHLINYTANLVKPPQGSPSQESQNGGVIGVPGKAWGYPRGTLVAKS